MKKAWLALVFGSALFLAACGGDDTDNSSSSGTKTDDNAAQTTASSGEDIIKKANCTTCHGANLEGVGSTPALKDVGSRLSQDEILNIIENGRNAMPAGLIKGDDAKVAAEWLAQQK